MSVAEVAEPLAWCAVDPVTVRLDMILAELQDSVGDERVVTDAVRIDRVARLEQIRAATAAAQAAESVRFARSQVAEQLAVGVHPRVIGRGIAYQLGLACHISPAVASRRLNTARALVFDLPQAYSKLAAGRAQ